MLRSPLRSPLQPLLRTPLVNRLAAAPYTLNFATLAAPDLSTRFGWSRTGAATMINSGQLVKYGAHNLVKHSGDLSNAAWLSANSALAAPSRSTVTTTLPDGSTGSVLRVSFPASGAASSYSLIYQASLTTQQTNQNMGCRVWVRQVSGGSTTGLYIESDLTGPSSGGAHLASIASISTAWAQVDVSGPVTGVAAGNYLLGFGVDTRVTGHTAIPAVTIDIVYASCSFGPVQEYVPTTTAARFLMRAPDYTHSVAGLLLEGARTNLVQSGNLGSQMADQTKTVTAAAHTISFYGTGTITLSGMHSAAVTGTGASVLTKLTFTPLAGGLILTVSGAVTDGLLEVGSYATSRVPNPTTGTMTRAADAADIGPGAEFNALFPAAAGTLVVEWVDTGATDGDIIALHSNGTTNELISLYYSGASILTLCRAGSANQLAATVGTRISNALNKAAISWGPSGLSAVLNGGTLQANASATLPAPTHARFAGTALASSAQGARKLTATRTRTTQFTGAALQALTV